MAGVLRGASLQRLSLGARRAAPCAALAPLPAPPCLAAPHLRAQRAMLAATRRACASARASRNAL
jgi:hypothetical protein